MGVHRISVTITADAARQLRQAMLTQNRSRSGIVNEALERMFGSYDAGWQEDMEARLRKLEVLAGEDR